jgi:hypothetical protein
MEAGGRSSTGTIGTSRRDPLANRKALRRAILAAATLLMLTLGPLGCGCDLKITTGSLPDAAVGVFYSLNLDSDCGGDTWFLASGGLPPGIALQANGDLEGVPTLAGVFDFTVGVVDFDSGDQASKGFTLTVHRVPPTP